jgi:putative (di)nucleoside polyphosphate hydrolase
VQSPLPYRPCVGVTLVNRAGAVFIGRRKKERAAERSDHAWQMPQGGIDKSETPLAAARRELREETSVTSAEFLAEAPEWLKYDLPETARGRWRGRYRGQTQKWFLFRFTGDEREINVERPADGAHQAEFDAWRWERLERLPDLVIPFKRQVYLQVAEIFAPFVHPVGD